MLAARRREGKQTDSSRTKLLANLTVLLNFHHSMVTVCRSSHGACMEETTEALKTTSDGGQWRDTKLLRDGKTFRNKRGELQRQPVASRMMLTPLNREWKEEKTFQNFKRSLIGG